MAARLVGSKVFVGKAWRLAESKCGAAVVYEFAIEGLRLAKSALGMCVQATNVSVTRCSVTIVQRWELLLLSKAAL